MVSKVKSEMDLKGLNSRLTKDKCTYAGWLESGMVSVPMQLRGTRKDSDTGFYWNRKEEFIAKYKYKISFYLVAKMLCTSNFYFIHADSDCHGFTRYMLLMNDSVVYVSVFTDERKIIKVLPLSVSA